MKTTSLRHRNGMEHLTMRVLVRSLSLFMHCRCDSMEDLPEEPIIFCCNHYEMFGPIAAIISLPVQFKFLINADILKPRENMEELLTGVRKAMPRLNERQIRRLYGIVSPRAERVFRQLDPVPMTQGWASVISEMQKATDEMVNGNSIVIFPECGTPTYSIGSVTEFRQGFAIIGEFYRKRTGKDALFCPTYIDKWEKQIHFGELIPYGSGPAREECMKVSQKLYHSMTTMAEKYGHAPEGCADDETLEEELRSVHG